MRLAAISSGAVVRSIARASGDSMSFGVRLVGQRLFGRKVTFSELRNTVRASAVSGQDQEASHDSMCSPLCTHEIPVAFSRFEMDYSKWYLGKGRWRQKSGARRCGCVTAAT